MFGFSDLVTCAVLDNGFRFLASNPAHLEFILSPFICNESLRNLVGIEHVKNCVDYVTNNRIHIAPYYQLDMTKRPSLAVVASGSESIQFIGDYGSTSQREATLPPTVFTTWDAKNIKKDTMKVSKNSLLEKKIWPGVVVTNGIDYAIVKGIIVKDNADTVLCLDRDLPDNSRLTGWKAQSDTKDRGVVINSSVDDVVVQVKLTTTGDYSLHRLLSVVTRYCLKKNRLMFDSMGMQVATFSYSPPMLTESSDLEFESVLKIEAKMTDSWIEKDFDFPNRASNVEINMIAESPGEEDVQL